MRARRRTFSQTNQPKATDALIAVARLLARETARECLGQARTPPAQQEHPRPDDPK
jgi:hypothetical protein